MHPRGKYVKGRFEQKDASFLHNLKTERFQEPRMFTMNQIRNMFYAMLNQSMEITRTTAAEDRLDKFDVECARLDATD